MSEALYPYYERELYFIRQLAREFAARYPAAAGRLLLEADRSGDPHVERLIESFALLAGRVHAKLDDEFPELTDALLNVLYPHYLAPVPSMAVVQFDLDPARAQLPKGFRIDRGSRLHTRPISGTPCRYRTCYPVTLWPVTVAEARFQPPPFPAGYRPPPKAAAVLRLTLECQSSQTFADLSLDTLRLYLNGDGQLVTSLYEMLLNSARRVEFRPQGGEPASPLPPGEALVPVGFGRDEGLLPYPPASFPGYRLLTELFTFPNKFWFIDLNGLGVLRKTKGAKRAEVLVWLDRTAAPLEQGVEASTFRLGATPVVNLFEQTAEPIPLTQTRYAYRIVPDVAQPLGTEVYSVDSVISTDPTSGTTTTYHPFYSFKHGSDRDTRQTFWYASRRPAVAEGDRGTDVELNLVNLAFRPELPADSVLVVRTTCTNRDIPIQLQRLGDRLTFDLEASAPVARVRTLRTPTAPLRPPGRRNGYWRLVSHLSLNHLSLGEGGNGTDALKEILGLYDFSDPASGEQLSAVNRQLIEGVLGVTGRRVTGRSAGTPGAGFCRGVEVTLELDEQKYVGTGVYLFASVMERFFGLYVSLNSFSQLVLRTRQAEGVIKRWSPRAGELPLL